MKNKILLLISIISLSFFQSLNAQQKVSFDPTNAREGENVEYCQSHKKMAELMKDPAYAKARQEQEAELQNILLSKKSGSTKSTVYKIPIVFHVLQNGGIENISDEQIMDALTILNRDFRRLNADAANVQPDFQGMPTDAEIEFVLATKSPNGNCFKGITRTLSPLSYQGADGNAQVTAIKNGNDVYQGNWAGNKYMNVFICGEIGGAAGYTTNPSGFSGSSMTNGIWILHNYVGSIGTSSENASRALTHEVGHWLNLSHTWGPNNNPGNASSCSSDDQVEDTPNCIGVTACLQNSNSCTETGSYWTYDVKDNVENYMDYSYCSKMYTQGQVDRMRAALTQTITGRANLWTTTNLTATGATGSLYLCKAEFNADKQTVCTGEQVQLFDDSYNAVTGWTWEITPATGWAYASGSSATTQNPVLIFSQSGLYTVKLTATDGSTTNSNTKSNYLRVLPVAATIPYWEGFEDYTTLNDLPNWEITNQNNNNKYELETTTSYSGTKCAKLTNFGQAASNIDDLTSSTIDLSSIPSNGTVTLSFRYSYRKKAAANYEYLKVFISADCGTSWAQRKTLGGSQLSSVSVATAWKPTQQSDWATVHMVNVTSAYFTDGFKMRFRFEGEGGNNFYLDDINLYAGSPSDNLVLGVSDLNDFGSLELFPNPTDDELNLRFTLDKKEDVTFMITDVSGKVAQKHLVKANEGSNLLLFDTKDLSSGMYFLTIGTANSSKTMQFVVK
jgi:PKD repeat protein